MTQDSVVDTRIVAVLENMGSPVVEVATAEYLVEITAPGPQGAKGDRGPVVESASWTYMGTITTYTGLGKWVYSGDYMLKTAQLSVASPPVGADIVVDVNINGASVFADPAGRPRIAAGESSGIVNFTPGVVVGVDDAITVDIDQVGSAYPGSTLVAIIRAEEI
jgi:hypothetical protein